MTASIAASGRAAASLPDELGRIAAEHGSEIAAAMGETGYMVLVSILVAVLFGTPSAPSSSSPARAGCCRAAASGPPRTST
ncbi:hypothetical protein MUN77_04930 [Leucobacter allii]|uniref:hypothetical protein n=1 Tax=Leucobacter allii TaxID=2932247 RepID=UPI001FD07713|nr:hypothetical protein [Leucobacter allii]UOR02657.1 hypothetical protein MUN77_04930 [Leucobacter allii]